MALQHSHRGTGTKAPHADGLVTAPGGNQRVLVVDRQVCDLGGVSPQRGQEPPVKGRPDLHQAVVRALASRNTGGGEVLRPAALAEASPLACTHCEDPETGAVESDTINGRQVAQDPPVQEHASIVVDRVDAGEALRSRQLSPTKDLNCGQQDVSGAGAGGGDTEALTKRDSTRERWEQAGKSL